MNVETDDMTASRGHGAFMLRRTVSFFENKARRIARTLFDIMGAGSRKAVKNRRGRAAVIGMFYGRRRHWAQSLGRLAH